MLNAASPVSPNSTVGVGLIGCRGKGMEILKYMLNHGGFRAVALCDVDQDILNERAATVESDFGHQPELYRDFRKMLENKDVDAVVIGTPDHWHCLPFVAACEAGKAVYVEKPLANTIEECNIMVRAAHRYNTVTQVGQQQRSGQVWTTLMDVLHDGTLGTLRKVNIWANFNYGVGQLMKPDEPAPVEVDFNLWLGPAPDRSFNPTRFHGSWRMFWDYGGGLMTDWGVHLLDMALWAKQVTEDPSEVLAFGKNLSFENHNHETFDTMSVTYPMRDYMITWQHTAGVQSGPYRKNYGLEFVGDNGTILANRSGWELIPEEESDRVSRPKLEETGFTPTSWSQSMASHVANFFDCIHSRKPTNCPIEIGRQVAIYAHAANIAVRSGEHRLLWDAQANRFSNSTAATSYVVPEYRKPWTLPEV